MRFWVGVISAFGAGLGIGAGLYGVLKEEQLKKEYKESTESFMRAIRLAQKTEVHVHVKEDEDIPLQEVVPRNLGNPATDFVARAVGDPIKVTEVENFKPEDENPYHQAVAQPQPSWTYLEQEDYEDDDDRVKRQITIMPGDDGMTPVFVMDDIEIADWEERIGSNILRDFYSLVPPDVVPAVLYVRNNVTQEDYEVIREVP